MRPPLSSCLFYTASAIKDKKMTKTNFVENENIHAIEFLSNFARKIGLGIRIAAGAGYWITESDGRPLDFGILAEGGYCPSKQCLERELLYLYHKTKVIG